MRKFTQETRQVRTGPGGLGGSSRTRVKLTTAVVFIYIRPGTWTQHTRDTTPAQPWGRQGNNTSTKLGGMARGVQKEGQKSQRHTDWHGAGTCTYDTSRSDSV